VDADIDEHGELLHDGFDWVSHWFTGGTHPYDIHEFLVQQAREERTILDLAYTLVTALRCSSWWTVAFLTRPRRLPK